MEAEVKKAGGMESIAGDVAQMERELQQRQMKRAKLVGARDAVRYQIRQHEAELNKPSFRSLDEEYRKLLIQHKVSALLWRMCVCVCVREIVWTQLGRRHRKWRSQISKSTIKRWTSTVLLLARAISAPYLIRL